MSRKYTEARKASNAAWDAANLDRMSVAAPRGTKPAIKDAASAAGQSINAYILDAVRQRMERDRMRKPGEAQKPKI